MNRLVLVVDDDPVQSLLATRLLTGQGFLVVAASDGQEALRLFHQHHPDLVLTDYHMPGMDGLELTRAIRREGGEHRVPVVMLTARTETDLLHAALEAGAVEFLTKPVVAEELLARMRALAELVDLHERLRKAKARTDQELAVVKHVLERFQALGRHQVPPCFALETLHTRRINGDTCLFRQGLPGVYFGLICDATGHGLMAGVSTIPVVEAFLSMVTKDIPLQAIYAEVNAKLRRLLPADRFVCLTLFRINAHQGVLSVLNAGMPDAWLLRGDGSLRTFPSTDLPAGVVETAPDDVLLVETSVEPGDRFLAMSDGLLDLFGAAAIPQMLLLPGRALGVQDHHADIRRRVLATVADAELADDISWALWEVPQAPRPAAPESSSRDRSSNLIPGIQVEYCLHPPQDSLSALLPSLHALLSAEGIHQEALQVLGLLTLEALVNALDHGLLGLRSSLKAEGGFETYERARQAQLETLRGGEIRLRVALFREAGPEGQPRFLEVEVQDTGPGFNWREQLAQAQQGTLEVFGRGLFLMRTMTTGLSFNEAGNAVRFGLDVG